MSDQRAQWPSGPYSALEKDRERVQVLGRAKERENLAFRKALKASSSTDEELDQRFSKLSEQVSAEIDCTQCAECCRGLDLYVTDEDLQRMAKQLGKTEAEFKAAHLRQEEGEGPRVATPCPMLNGTRCSYYDQRPETCRSYPHLEKPEMRSRLFSVMANAAICPIAYNVVERLKVDFGWRPSRRHR